MQPALPVDPTHLHANNIIMDVTDDRELLINGQTEILDMISQGASLTSILEAIVLWVERMFHNRLFVSILLMDEQGKRLLHGAAPSLPESYNNAINGILIGPQVGTCGAAAYLKKSIITEDIAQDPSWEGFRHLALGVGLRAAWSTPLITKSGKVLGTFGIYFKERRGPRPEEIQLIKLVSRTAEIAIEFKLSEKEKNKLVASEKFSFDIIRQQHQQFYRLLMDAPALIAFLRGPEHVYELANPKYLEVVGEKRNLIGKPIRIALPELEGQGIYELLDHVYKTGESHFDQELLVKLDRSGKGELEDVFFNFVFQAIKNDVNEVQGIFIHAVDVTELVTSRNRFKESEERFRSFVLNSPTPIGIYVGREMRVQTANDAILEAWGKDKSVIGKTFREALPELEGQPFYQLLDDVYTTGKTYKANEGRVDLVRNGQLETTYFNFSYKALRDETGKIYGVINTGTEVTDLVEARQKLAEAEEGFRIAIDVAELGTWNVDLLNGVVTCSERVMEWFQLTKEPVTMKDVLRAIHPDDIYKVESALKTAIDTLGTYEAEYRITDSSSRERILHAKGQVFTDDMNVARILSGTLRDVTMQKMTEQELERQVEKRTRELEKANIDLHNTNDNLKQFAYVASHDLQEPLRKINMFSDILLHKEDVNTDHLSRMYLQKIAQSASRMTTLIRDLLDFSRVDTKENSFPSSDLNVVLQNIKVDFEVLIHNKRAELLIGSLPVVDAIPLQMNQLFFNLIGNSLKYAKENVPPLIQISSSILTQEEVLEYPRLNSRWQHCRITVTDNGIGFDQQFAEQIFTIFQRLHGRNEYEGTGIGLALCKKIIENHDGEIYASSVKGEGSSFHVILPVKRNAE